MAFCWKAQKTLKGSNRYLKLFSKYNTIYKYTLFTKVNDSFLNLPLVNYMILLRASLSNRSLLQEI